MDFLTKRSRTKIKKMGKKFGKLEVLSVNEEKYKETGKMYYNCICDCGNKVVINTSDLNENGTKQCMECARSSLREKVKKHGLRHHPLYKKYRGMMDRCYNPNHEKNKRNYQDIGIHVCDEWKGEKGFEIFYDWAINSGYEYGLSLERLDVYKNYEPSNCCWISMREQQFNKKNTFFTKEGVNLSKLLYYIDREQDYGFIYSRLRIAWDLKKALNTPKKGVVLND